MRSIRDSLFATENECNAVLLENGAYKDWSKAYDVREKPCSDVFQSVPHSESVPRLKCSCSAGTTVLLPVFSAMRVTRDSSFHGMVIIAFLSVSEESTLFA